MEGDATGFGRVRVVFGLHVMVGEAIFRCLNGRFGIVNE